MTAEQRLRLVIDEILHYMWDPIGVAGTPEARDEYAGYVGKVLAYALEENEPAIHQYLREMETKHMGVAGDASRCADVADCVMRWKAALMA